MIIYYICEWKIIPFTLFKCPKDLNYMLKYKKEIRMNDIKKLLTDMRFNLNGHFETLYNLMIDGKYDERLKGEYILNVYLINNEYIEVEKGNFDLMKKIYCEDIRTILIENNPEYYTWHFPSLLISESSEYLINSNKSDYDGDTVLQSVSVRSKVSMYDFIKEEEEKKEMINMNKDNLDFNIESEVKGISTFKEAVKLFEDEYENRKDDNKEEEVLYIISCLKNFYKTKAVKSIENIKYSFMNGMINTRNFTGIDRMRDVADPSPESSYMNIPYDYTLYFNATKYGTFELKILREDEILLWIDTNRYETNVPLLSMAEERIISMIHWEDDTYLCRDLNGDLYFMRSHNYPLKNSNYDSEATPSRWISDKEYSERKYIEDGLFKFVTFSDKCWSKKELNELRSTVCKLEVKNG